MAAHPVHEILATPEPPKPAASLMAVKEKVTEQPPEAERTTTVDMPEKDPILPVLTLPEPVVPIHLSPYVAEALTVRPSEPIPAESVPVISPPQILAPHYEQQLPTVEVAEGIRPEPEVILTEAMSAEIEKIINTEPAPETTVDLTWAEFTAAHEPDIEREPTPLESFTYFTKSLENWHDTPSLKIAETTDEPDIAAELPAELEMPQADKKAMIAISHEVAERLTHLEPVEVEEVAPVIAEISTAINKLQELSNPKTEEDIIALAETKEELEELCKQLFEALDIEYDEASINYFIQVMLLKQFKDSVDMAAYKDRLGTHEFKHHFPAFGAIAQLIAGEVFHFMLGRLALLQTNPQEKRQLAQSPLSV